MQFFTAYILIGYIWSWYWAYLIVTKAFDPRGMQANPASVSNMASNPNYAANPVGYDNDPSGFGNNRQNYANMANPGGIGMGPGGYQQQQNNREEMYLSLIHI